MNKNIFLRLRDSNKREELVDLVTGLEFSSFGSNQLAFVIKNAPEDVIDNLKKCTFVSRVYSNTIPYSTITSYSDPTLQSAARKWNKYSKKKQYELPGTQGIRDYLGL